MSNPFDSLRSHSGNFLLGILIAAAIPAAAQTQFLVVTTAVDDAGTAANCTPQAAAGSGTDATCSLRDALTQAALSTAPSINVSFDATVFSATNATAANTITLTAGSLNVPSNTSVSGPTSGSGAAQANLITVSGNNASTVFTIGTGATAVQLSGLNIVEGSAAQGGGIVNAGTLVVNNCSISGNAATSSSSGVATGGGGILNSGKLTVNGSTIAANSATAVGAVAEGGGILNSGNLSLAESTITGNSTSADGTGEGGGIFTTNAPGSSLSLTGATIFANTADGAGGGIFSSRTAAAAMSQPQNRTLQTLGDSITYGYASSGCPAPYQVPTTLADSYCWAGLVAYNLGYSLHDTGVSNSGAGDVSAIQIYNSPRYGGSDNGQFVPGPATISTFLIGQVDDGVVPDETINYFNGTRDVTEWQMQHEDVMAFMFTPNKRVANSTACTASTGWSSSTLWTTGGLETTTTGATITCAIVGSTAYVSVMAQVGNASTISISIDGGAATPYPYALSSASRGLGNPTSGELFRIPNLQPDSPGTPAATAPHTITITANVNGSSPVFVNWVDGNGNEAANGAGPVVFALAPYQTDIRTDANGALPRFRSFLAEEAADLRSDGFNEIVGDLSVPCTAIPVTDPPVSLCDTFDGTHPLDSGHALIAAYVEQLILNSITFGNSIVSGNTSPLGADTNDLYIDDGGNQIGVSGVGLAPLGSYGGPTQTMTPLPGSPALCAGTAGNLNGVTTDQRGLPRSTTYGATNCVDSGAVQTNYALAFSTEPPATVNFKIPIAPAPVAALTESGAAATEAATTVSLTDKNGLLSGTTEVNLASGSAAFTDLILPSATTNDALLATLALTPSLNLTTLSSAFNVTQATPTVSVVPGASSVTTLDAVSATITVSGGAGGPIPGGAVTLAGGGYTSAATTLSNGSVSIAIPAGALAIGGDTLTASYSGDSVYLAANGSASPITVAKAASAVAVTPSATAITAAQALSVKIVVSGNGSAPTGSVTLSSGAYAPAAAALNGGSATISVPPGSLAIGANTLTASYSGDATYLGSTGTTSPVAVAKATSVVALTPSASSISTTQPLSVTIVVSAGAGQPTPTGSVTLTSGAYSSAAVLGNGSAIVAVPAEALAAGADALTASYSGDGIYLPASSTASTLNVSKTVAALTVTPSIGSITTTQSMSVTVVVSAGGGGPIPTGTVTLTSGAFTAAAIALSNGSATIAIPAEAIAAGADALTASYSGDGIYLPVSSAASTVNVSKTAASLTVTPSTRSITTTQPLTLTAVASGGNGNPAPTGTVIFTSGTYTSAATALSSGNARVTIPAGMLAVGADTLTASYAGDATYTQASAAALPVAVAKAASTLAVTTAASSITAVQSLNVMAMASGGSGNPTPTGTVTLTSGSYTSAPIAISNGDATIAIPAGSLAGGADTLTVSYSGDRTYLAATGSAAITVQSFTVSGTAVTVAPGAAAGNTSTISLSSVGGFTGPVALAAILTTSPAGALDLPTFSFGAGTLATITGPSGGTAALTIATTAASSGTCTSTKVTPARAPWVAGGGAVLACVCLLGFPRRRRWQSWLGMVLLLVGLSGGVLACGVNSTNGKTDCTGTATAGTTAGDYTITVTGSSAGIAQTATVTLTVQ
jgi:lysophospholipase L1-like esterase